SDRLGGHIQLVANDLSNLDPCPEVSARTLQRLRKLIASQPELRGRVIQHSLVLLRLRRTGRALGIAQANAGGEQDCRAASRHSEASHRKGHNCLQTNPTKLESNYERVAVGVMPIRPDEYVIGADQRIVQTQCEAESVGVAQGEIHTVREIEGL